MILVGTVHGGEATPRISTYIEYIEISDICKPRAPVTSSFEGQPPKTRVIWVQSIYNFQSKIL